MWWDLSTVVTSTMLTGDYRVFKSVPNKERSSETCRLFGGLLLVNVTHLATLPSYGRSQCPFSSCFNASSVSCSKLKS